MMPPGFFPAVEPDSPVRPLLERVRPAVEAEAAPTDGSPVTVQAELRAARGPDGQVVLERFYWSVQHRDETSELGFRARTLHWAREGEPRAYDFPSDPKLSWLGHADGPLRSDARAGRVGVLRYIPLRRVTYRLTGCPGLPDTVIAKAKGAGGLHRAALAVMAVGKAAGRHSGGVPVPELVRLEPPRHVLYLRDLPGDPLDVAVRTIDTEDAMRQLATLHRRLQRLDVPGLPVRRTKDWMEDARAAVEQLRLFVPSAASGAAAVCAELERSAPPDDRLVFCQGDFLPSQVLCHPSSWAVIDFDDSRYADPLSDVAAMYAGMPRELHLPADEAEHARRAYLDAYVDAEDQPFDEHRWRWFLTQRRLTEVVKRVAKGRADTEEVGTVLDHLTPRAGG